MLATLLVVLVYMIQGLESLRDVTLEAPEAVRTGGFLTLTCAYHLDRNSLYTAKLYLEDTEFFRFVPRDRPPTMMFPLQDASVHLQMNSLNKSVVTLGPMHRGLAGIYKCEVTEEPLFHTIIKSYFVSVTEDPVSRPSLVTSKSVYNEGEDISARCSSRGGHPPVNITWYLDDKQISDSAVAEIRSYVIAGDVDMSVSDLRLSVPPSPHQFRLRCTASQFDIYLATTDRLLRINYSVPHVPTNQTVSLSFIPSQPFSFMLLFVYSTFVFSVF
ncbi:uncharacterized protein LOC128983259 [Macrosteles quadrilineatus]|uniref:uncharacterized protein LOC128983259 n=1 Tax=Macrosteles quadrilineatus TaxID=74068 RepID=UPI0023E32D1D|nr:uncharacterized protein LOC128983259 [Macrosteles quadrilineatus]